MEGIVILVRFPLFVIQLEVYTATANSAKAWVAPAF